MNEELERFKTEINLAEYAASLGYRIDRAESSRNSIVMRCGNDKVIISRSDDDGHWRYFSVRDSQDNGTIIDFIQYRDDISLGTVRVQLRSWLSGFVVRPPAGEFVQEVEPSMKCRELVSAAFSSFMASTGNNPYLRSRGISSDTLSHPRFSGKVFLDQRGNSIFPHYDHEGLSGYEIKNHSFTGFAKHGSKSAWSSNLFGGDDCLVFTESAIDAMSYFQLFQEVSTRYVSIGGQFSPLQIELFKLLISDLPKGSSVVFAFDNDAEGNNYAAWLSDLVLEYAYLRHTPLLKDWNEILRPR